MDFFPAVINYAFRLPTDDAAAAPPLPILRHLFQASIQIQKSKSKFYNSLKESGADKGIKLETGYFNEIQYSWLSGCVNPAS